jgi:hypothetical protein
VRADQHHRPGPVVGQLIGDVAAERQDISLHFGYSLPAAGQIVSAGVTQTR